MTRNISTLGTFYRCSPVHCTFLLVFGNVLVLTCAILLIFSTRESYHLQIIDVPQITCNLLTRKEQEHDASKVSKPRAKLLLIGVFTMAEKFERRSLIRASYKPLFSDNSDLVFVLGQVPKQYETLVRMEHALYKDILVLPMRENMNEGKTFSFFWAAATLFGNNSDSAVTYDFVMKADDDSFFYPPNLEKAVANLPKKGCYYGRMINREKRDPFMVGMGFALSFDLAQYLATSEYARSHSVGNEDGMIARALQLPKDTPLQVVYSTPWEEFSDQYGEWTPPYSNRSIAMHTIKQNDRFLTAVDYFLKDFVEEHAKSFSRDFTAPDKFCCK